MNKISENFHYAVERGEAFNKIKIKNNNGATRRRKIITPHDDDELIMAAQTMLHQSLQSTRRTPQAVGGAST